MRTILIKVSAVETAALEEAQKGGLKVLLGLRHAREGVGDGGSLEILPLGR